MNILITGGNGFIAKSIYPILAQSHTVYAPVHTELDVLDIDKTKYFIEQHNIEVVIHSANIIGRHFKLLQPGDVYKSLLIFESIVCASQSCKIFINFGAGAEFGGIISPMIYRKESELSHVVPLECGGFAKYIMAQRTLKFDKPLGFNLRIAGCFGEYEKEDRFIKSNLNRIINHQPIIIHQNKHMDYIYVKDLAKIIQCIIQNPQDYPRDINCVYNTKYSLIDIARIIIDIVKYRVPIEIQNPGLGLNYTLDGTLLNSLNIQLQGIRLGIKQVYESVIKTT